jgi:hypothetical protein
MTTMVVGMALVIVAVAYVLFPLFRADRAAADSPPDASSGGNRCAQCGAQTPPEALFCPRCGRASRVPGAQAPHGKP